MLLERMTTTRARRCRPPNNLLTFVVIEETPWLTNRDPHVDPTGRPTRNETMCAPANCRACVHAARHVLPVRRQQVSAE